ISIIASSTSDTNRIAIADGWSPHDHASVLSPDRILAYEPLGQSVKDGRVVLEPQPPGWFERPMRFIEVFMVSCSGSPHELGRIGYNGGTPTGLPHVSVA